MGMTLKPIKQHVARIQQECTYLRGRAHPELHPVRARQ